MNGCINMFGSDLYQQALRKIVGTVEVRDKSFLVTGATGLIGSCIIDLLMECNNLGYNNNVYALGRSAKKLQDRFSNYIDSPLFHIIEQNIIEPIDADIKFDFIFHGASNADPGSYAKYPVETMTTNFLGTNNVLEYGKSHPGCKLLIMSTFEVYGDKGQDIYIETDSGVIDINAIRSCYPESKRSVEILSRCYNNEYDVDVRVARLSSIYGPTMAIDDSKAHAQFLKKAINGENIILKSKGLQKRTYTYVIDAVTALMCVMFKGLPGEAYNISNENSVASIAEVAYTCAEIANTRVSYDMPSELEARGFSKPQNCILDNSKLKELGWEGRYSIKDGLFETYNILLQGK